MINIIFFLLLSSISKEEILKNSPLIHDKNIAKVASGINNYIENNNNKIISRDFLLKELNKNKIYSYKVLPFTYSLQQDKLYEQVKIDLSLNQVNYNRVGISKSEKYLTILLVNKQLEIKHSTIKKQYQTITIHGKSIDYKDRIITLYIKTPKYKIKNFFIPLFDKKFNISYKLKEKGKYIFEFVDISENDPKIVAKFPIIIGKNSKVSSCHIKTEKDILNDINKIREENNLKPLKLSKRLSSVATNYSREMADNSFFSHNSPINGTPYKRVLKSGVKFQKILENISKASNLCMSHHEIINSPGHLRNILDKDIDKIGLGIFYSKNTVYLTENFIQSKKEKVTVNRLKEKLKSSIKNKNQSIKNDNYLNHIAQIKNNSEFLKIKKRENTQKIMVNGYKKIESYFFIIREFQDIISELKNIKPFDSFGIDIKKYKIKNEELIFISIILGKTDKLASK